MDKNNVGFLVKIIGAIIGIGGCTWGVIVLFGSDFQQWIVALFFILFSLFLGCVLWGLSEIIQLLDRQTDTQLRLEEKLRRIVPPEEGAASAVTFCNRCGTQLPPGGKTCPTCHHVNE